MHQQKLSLTNFSLQLLLIFVVMFLLQLPALAQEDDLTRDLPIPDVTIMVLPTRQDAAHVVVAFNGKVPHTHVQEAIDGLAKQGWAVGKVEIKDESLLQNAISDTGASFRVANAPQVVNNAPVVVAYLAAFRRWKIVEVVFDLPPIEPYQGIDRAQNSTTMVTRLPEANGYHYFALPRSIKTTSEPSPSPKALEQDALVEVPKNLPQPEKKNLLLPIILILVGVGIFGGMGAYVILSKRANNDT